ncbi:HDOD domain-containing protein [Methylotenera sp.]|uniref:HDOD domain-containing protein n=1 Tax=Methylotenera sp. TaxID=2051956 RepID=UPI00272F5059|nr:HDOD domain-containing protein [Methylotenera sp.]MDP2071514.1 HDOD domain-containing protein [Methylotenera sp.]MDP2231797.1 HDOD domain-containing protein [Methylotenera sp.]MDP3004963.1 HDOD domain-containing protein [Methylotenera sp.]MDP3142290.1 HDOD domain-containing protein [Methylotenera sp.]MDZ4212299.1 HDOD domain-containing protein [Methylotenera sp.]
MSSTPQELVTRDISAWIDFIRKAEIPVLKHTAREIARLKEDEDNLSARAISSAVLNDPMMVFKVLTFSQKHKGKKQLQDLVQADQAILMMGTSSFFLNLQPKVLVEDILKSNLPALMHLLRLVRRAHQAAHFAADWATHLADLHAEEVRTAALLHDLAEMLMWCFAPDKMNAIYAMQHADKTLRSVAVQQDVLGFRLQDLQKELVEIFQLPPLLSKLMQDNASSEQRVRNVILAINLARHSANGWDDAALPDDYSDIAALLRMDIDRVMRIVGVPRIQ